MKIGDIVYVYSPYGRHDRTYEEHLARWSEYEIVEETRVSWIARRGNGRKSKSTKRQNSVATKHESRHRQKRSANGGMINNGAILVIESPKMFNERRMSNCSKRSPIWLATCTIQNGKTPGRIRGQKNRDAPSGKGTRWEGRRKGRAARNIPAKIRMYDFVGVPVSIPDCFIAYYEKSS